MHISDEQQRCSFCGKPRSEVAKLIAGPSVFICLECVRICDEIVTDCGQGAAGGAASNAPPKPREIKRLLDDHIIGQDQTKKRLAVAVYHNATRVGLPGRKANGVEMGKSNLLLVGPTGSGKPCRVGRRSRCTSPSGSTPR